jgi:hypothetical protein
MVNDTGFPLQPFKLGVTVIVAVTVVAPELMAVNDGMLPVPEAARPIEVLSLVQLKVVPTGDPLKFIVFVELLLQTV